MKKNKECFNVNTKEHNFSIADYDYFHNDEDENEIFNAYIAEKALEISIFLLAVLLGLFILYILLYRI